MLYDVLKSPVIDKEKPRGTGDDIVAQMPFEICKLINARKKLVKLSRDFVDLLPTKVSIDNRVHGSFLQCGTDTGRFSSKNPNLQQIPSHAKDIRLLFKASTKYDKVDCLNDSYALSRLDEVQVDKNVWKKVKDIVIGDKLYTSENTYDIISKIVDEDDFRVVYVN